MRRAICVLTILIWAAALAGACLAAEFSADMTSSQVGGSMGKFYIKADKVRMEMSGPQGESAISIVDTKQRTVYMLMPKQKMYMDLSGVAAQSQPGQFESNDELDKIADRKLAGTETVNGYSCDKYEIIYRDKSRGTATQWIAKKLNFPIKMAYDGPYGAGVIEYKNIREGGVNDGLFEIPAGYQKMSMPKMGSMGMTGQGMNSEDYPE